MKNVYRGLLVRSSYSDERNANLAPKSDFSPNVENLIKLSKLDWRGRRSVLCRDFKRKILDESDEFNKRLRTELQLQ